LVISVSVPTSLAVNEMQITEIFLHSNRIAIINNTNNNKCGWECRWKGTFFQWEYKLVITAVWKFLKKP
jgi:hypothetical protein